MYIIKNAFRCIGRAKGRNVLIGIIALVISVSACIGLSIRQASENAKSSALEGMNITATISYDRANAMGQIGGMGGFSGFDRNQFADLMGSASSLTLEDYQKYAEASSVDDFYYTLTAYFNGDEEFSHVSDEADDEEESSSSSSSTFPNFSGNMGGMMGDMFSSLGDFSIVGYSSDSSMTDFVDGNASITDGVMFEEGTSELNCVISEELAIYNDLAIGDTVTVSNPSLETETYTLTISGIYTSSENNDFSMSMFGASQDPANRIYMSAAALQTVLDASEENSTTVTDSYNRESEKNHRHTFGNLFLCRH